jgi:hypothetical protein
MCFTIDNWESPGPKVAQKDIVCYKILNRRYSPHYYPFRYKWNKLNERIDLKITWGNMISEGYHSYKKLKVIPGYDNNSQVPSAKFRIYKMIIPKGTLYYENEKEYVSETIILKRLLLYSLIYHIWYQ